MKFLVLIATAAVLQAACSSADSRAVEPQTDCTLDIRPGIKVTIVDSLSGQPVAAAAAVTAQEGSYSERAVGQPPQYFMAYERKGTYDVTVQIDGFQTWRMDNVVVSADRCHVDTVTLMALLVH